MPLETIRLYTRQLLTGLGLLKECGIVHADLKPSNVLVDKTGRRVAICDFGCATWEIKCEVTGNEAALFYRAPEISNNNDCLQHHELRAQRRSSFLWSLFFFLFL